MYRSADDEEEQSDNEQVSFSMLEVVLMMLACNLQEEVQVYDSGKSCARCGMHHRVMVLGEEGEECNQEEDGGEYDEGGPIALYVVPP